MKRLAELALLAGIGLALSLLWLHYAGFNGPRDGIAATMAGTADRPFVYRQLAAWLVRSIIAITGVVIIQAAVSLVMLSFVGWLWALRWLAGGIATPGEASWGTVLAAGPVGLLFVSGGYVYDPLMLALFTLALALLARRHWLAYCVLFPALVLCRETAILLTLVYAVWAWRRVDRGDYILSLWWQVMVFVFVKALLAMAYSRNGGAALEFNLGAQVAFLLRYPLPNVLALGLYSAALSAGLLTWRDQHPFMRSAAVVLPVMFVAYWTVGYPGEIRVFLEAYPVLYLLTWHTVWTRAALPTRAFIRRLYSGQSLKQTARFS